jgi:hypothetical protein
VLGDEDRSLDEIGAGGSGNRAPGTQADDDDERRAGYRRPASSTARLTSTCTRWRR